jgi:hypothetical protein
MEFNSIIITSVLHFYFYKQNYLFIKCKVLYTLSYFELVKKKKSKVEHFGAFKFDR